MEKQEFKNFSEAELKEKEAEIKEACYKKIKEEKEKEKNPNVLICGAARSGKASVVRHITNLCKEIKMEKQEFKNFSEAELKEKEAEIKEACYKKIKEEKEKEKNPNVLICGATRSGKTSAVKHITNLDLETSNFEPCSKGIKYYPNETINIYDSEGYEIGSEKQKHYNDLIFDFLNKQKNPDTKNRVNLVWYCIPGAAKRITDLDIELIFKINNLGFNICVLITKIDEMSQEDLNILTKAIKEEFPNIDIFKLSIKLDKSYCDWEKLIEWSYGNLSDEYRIKFTGGINNNFGLDIKRKQANTIVNLAAIASAGVGASPIPFSDALILIPIQTAMCAKILSIYNIEVGTDIIISFVQSVIISNLGKTIVSQLLKIVPILGSVINAGVAGAITKLLGEATIRLGEYYIKTDNKDFNIIDMLFKIVKGLKLADFKK